MKKSSSLMCVRHVIMAANASGDVQTQDER